MGGLGIALSAPATGVRAGVAIFFVFLRGPAPRGSINGNRVVHTPATIKLRSAAIWFGISVDLHFTHRHRPSTAPFTAPFEGALSTSTRRHKSLFERRRAAAVCAAEWSSLDTRAFWTHNQPSSQKMTTNFGHEVQWWFNHLQARQGGGTTSSGSSKRERR